MPFPLPTPQELTRQQEALLEEALIRARPDASPQAVARAVRSPRGVLAAIARTQAQALYGAHLHLRWWGDQYLPDTAEAELLARHSAVWGIARRPATRAIGRAEFAGLPGTAIPAGYLLTGPRGARVETLEAGEIALEGAATLDLRAVEPGTEGNVEGEATLSPVTPLAGLDTVTADEDGLAGGAAQETDAGLLERVLERIRRPPHGGARHDYPVWVMNEFAAAKVRTLTHWLGVGSVGVAVAMGTAVSPRPPIPAEIKAIAEHLDTERPVTAAELVVVPVTLVPVDFEIRLEPDTPQVRGAVEAGIETFFAREAEIGGRLRFSRLTEAISAARGEFAHDLIAPDDNLDFGPAELPVPGNIMWAA